MDGPALLTVSKEAQSQVDAVVERLFTLSKNRAGALGIGGVK